MADLHGDLAGVAMALGKRRRVHREPYVPPPDAPPLREVVLAIGQKTKQLGELDDRISMAIATLERRLRAMPFTRIVSAKLPDGAELGWSYTRRGNRWRFVIRDEDEAWDLMSCSREERCEVFTCGAMEKLVQQVLQS